MYTSRRLTSILILALLLQTFVPFVPSVRAEVSSPSSPHAVNNAPRIDGFGFDHTPLGPESEPGSGKEPYLPMLYKTDTRVIVTSSPANATGVSGIAASETITNDDDIMYLVNSKQIGRTTDFTAGSPSWHPLTATLVMTDIRDFILDPQDPYHTAWAVGNSGIWRTTNSEAITPTWQSIRSMNQISDGTGVSANTIQSVLRIIGDVSRPDYFGYP